jgi:hypothetical protein
MATSDWDVNVADYALSVFQRIVDLVCGKGEAARQITIDMR